MAKVDRDLGEDLIDGLYRLREILEPVEALYRYTFIDNPPNLGYGALNTLVAATDVLGPVQLEGPAIFALTETLHTIRRIQEKPNPSLRLLGILPTMTNFRREEDKEWLEALRKHTGAGASSNCPTRGSHFCLTQGLDIFSFKPPRRPEALASATWRLRNLRPSPWRYANAWITKAILCRTAT